MQIDIFYFVIGACIGFSIVYMLVEPAKPILRNPDPKNPDKDIYVDDNNICYRYKREVVQCPSNSDNNVVKI